MHLSNRKKRLIATSFIMALVAVFVTLVPIEQVEAGFLFGDDNKQQLLNNGISQNNDSGGEDSTSTTDSTSITSRSINATPPAVVPEPSTIVLLASGLIGLGLWRLKRKP